MGGWVIMWLCETLDTFVRPEYRSQVAVLFAVALATLTYFAVTSWWPMWQAQQVLRTQKRKTLEQLNNSIFDIDETEDSPRVETVRSAKIHRPTLVRPNFTVPAPADASEPSEKESHPVVSHRATALASTVMDRPAARRKHGLQQSSAPTPATTTAAVPRLFNSQRQIERVSTERQQPLNPFAQEASLRAEQDEAYRIAEAIDLAASKAQQHWLERGSRIQQTLPAEPGPESTQNTVTLSLKIHLSSDLSVLLQKAGQPLTSQLRVRRRFSTQHTIGHVLCFLESLLRERVPDLPLGLLPILLSVVVGHPGLRFDRSVSVAGDEGEQQADLSEPAQSLEELGLSQGTAVVWASFSR